MDPKKDDRIEVNKGWGKNHWKPVTVLGVQGDRLYYRSPPTFWTKVSGVSFVSLKAKGRTWRPIPRGDTYA